MTGVQTCALPICFPVTIASGGGGGFNNAGGGGAGGFIETFALNIPIATHSIQVGGGGAGIVNNGSIGGSGGGACGNSRSAGLGTSGQHIRLLLGLEEVVLEIDR